MGTLHCPDCDQEWAEAFSKVCWICNREGERGPMPYEWSAYRSTRYNVENPPVF